MTKPIKYSANLPTESSIHRNKYDYHVNIFTGVKKKLKAFSLKNKIRIIVAIEAVLSQLEKFEGRGSFLYNSNNSSDSV